MGRRDQQRRRTRGRSLPMRSFLQNPTPEPVPRCRPGTSATRHGVSPLRGGATTYSREEARGFPRCETRSGDRITRTPEVPASRTTGSAPDGNTRHRDCAKSGAAVDRGARPPDAGRTLARADRRSIRERGDPDHQRDQEVDHDLGIRSQENRERFGPHPGHGLSLTARGHTRYYVRREESTKWAKRSAAPPNARPLPPNAVIPSEPQRPPLVARPAQAPMTIPGMMTARRAGTSRACGLRSISRHRATPQFGDRLVTLLATL
jgi:hypothetical protein